MKEKNNSYKIGWKVSSLSMDTASIRYRALLPLIGLEESGIQSKIFSLPLEDNLRDLNLLIIVKSLTVGDIYLCQKAKKNNIPIIFDLCDNVFIDGYGADKNKNIIQILNEIFNNIDAVTTTTEPLAQVITKNYPKLKVVIIPDGIETNILQKKANKLLVQSKKLEDNQQRQQTLLRELGQNLKRIAYREPSAFKLIVKSYLIRISNFNKAFLKNKLGILNKTESESKKKEFINIPSTLSKRIIWFGNHGASYANFGMLDLLEIKDTLEKIAQEFEVELVIISNNEKKYNQYILPLKISSCYVEWSPLAVEKWLEVASLVVIPNTLDSFSICKSANRTVLAVNANVPVVATPTPALLPLASYIYLGNTLDGLRHYLSNPERGKKDASNAAHLAKKLFGLDKLTSTWLSVINEVTTQYYALHDDYHPNVIITLHLIQDLDLALPIILKLIKQKIKLQLWVNFSLIKKSPRVLATIQKYVLPYQILMDSQTGDIIYPDSVKFLLTIAETNLGPHRFTHWLSNKAKEQGIFVATMQHGFDNVGLTYSDNIHSIDKINFSAERIYIWGKTETLHPNIPENTLKKCLPIGCSKPAFDETADLSDIIPVNTPIIGIFENLHWHRYDDHYRSSFLTSICELAELFPEITILVKPHHAGLWLTKRHKGETPDLSNLLIADPQNPLWEHYTATSLLGHMTAVITTPSTVALDAARASLPTAVFAMQLDLRSYEPLPLIHSSTQLIEFVRTSLSDDRLKLIKASNSYVDKVLIPGDAATKIANDIIKHAININ